MTVTSGAHTATVPGRLPARMLVSRVRRFRSQRRIWIARPGQRRGRRWSLSWMLLVLSGCGLGGVCQAQSALPDAPTPNLDPVERAALTADSYPAPDPAAGQQTFPPQGRPERPIRLPELQPGYVPTPQPCESNTCSQQTPARSCCKLDTDVFQNYLRQNALHIYTPKELGRLAINSVIDPFNLLTIGMTSAFSVATDSHSPYGPGVLGIAKYSGVSLTQDMTGAFFSTFLIPSIDHQDPHYHRMPNAPLPWRIAHCLYQPFWTDSDTGKGMPNYSTLVGSLADEAIDIAYVPYQQVGWGPSAARIATGWAFDPVGNFVTEFVPDVARHINLNIVFVQRIINRVAIEEGGAPTAQ